jgi:hypothetical protein
MHVMHARFHRGVWRIHASPSRYSSDAPPSPEDALRRGRRAALAWRRRLIDDGESEAACAEFPKATIGEGEVAIGYAELVAERCASGGEAGFSVAAPRQWLSRRSVARALRARGLPVAHGANGVIMDALSMLVAGIAAWCMLLLHAVTYARTSDTPPGEGWWLAVHGEWSNRTRHVLAAVAGSTPPSAILVLGRPRSGLSAVAAEWSSRLGIASLPMILRPWSLACVLQSVPAACAATAGAMRISASAPYLPSFSERVGMLYRTYLGLSSARWWHHQRPRPRRVVYGHTGNADTTPLELAQQGTGQQTWHIVHGISNGLNFTGRSSVAAFACAHDAHWHDRLGGYGRCLHFPALIPATVLGPSGLLLLTNYAHPMNVEYRASGTGAEEAVLHAVSSAARRIGVSELAWRPHPALASLDKAEQDALRSVARTLGFLELPPEQDWLEVARRSRWVVTTASTVCIQLLEAGVVPVVLVPDWMDPDCALTHHPLSVRELARLPEALSSLGETELDRCQIHSKAWRKIGPARNATAADWME